MQYDENVLTRTERRIFALRTLYSRAGYSSYRMRKFEDYDLYSRNKDFLLSDRVITFTDTNGKLKALKPDVTLSIVKNIEDTPSDVNRLFYDENVYRVSGRTGTFREIMQMGLECIGNADNAAAAEVIGLAEQSLALMAEDNEYILRISDIDILTLLVDGMTDSGEVRGRLLKLISGKNIHGIESLCAENEIPDEKCRTLVRLLGLYGSPAEAVPELEDICRGTEAEDEVDELKDVLGGLFPVKTESESSSEGADSESSSEGAVSESGSEIPDSESSRIVMDFSIVGDTNYYNGMAFEGYIDGIPECVLIGGRYDKLMRRMKKKSRAIGFAIYLDTLGMMGRTAGDRAIENFYDK